jgi:hypothetical protein
MRDFGHSEDDIDDEGCSTDNRISKLGNISHQNGVYIAMLKRSLTLVAVGLVLSVATAFPQNASDALTDAARNWLKNISAGSRAELNASMDERFIATTPAGDVLVKERLVPSDPSQPVQQMPAMELDGPIARTIGETGIVMSRLKSSVGPALNATFVFAKQQSGWKLVALHLSPVGR